jgi:Rieske Fe-S protein
MTEMSSGMEGLGLASRRAVLVGAGAAAVAVLAGCQTYDSNAPVEEPDVGPADDPGDGTAAALVQTAQVPVGGGIVLDQQRVVVTQPQAGTFKCFTAVCTHQGCLVSEVKGGTINCPCHGSAFKVADGSVATGPANKALRAIDIKVEGTDIKLA